MKPHSIVAAASAAIALIFLFAAQPLLASTDSQCTGNLCPVANFKFARVDNNNNYWIFSWDTAADEDKIKFQMKGGGISSIWVSLRQRNVARANGTTELGVTPLNIQSGTSAQFRVSVEVPDGYTDWAETTLSNAA